MQPRSQGFSAFPFMKLEKALGTKEKALGTGLLKMYAVNPPLLISIRKALGRGCYRVQLFTLFYMRGQFEARFIFLMQIQASDVTHRFIATALFRIAKNDHAP